MDRQSAYTLSVFPEDRESVGEDSRQFVQEQLVRFILEFHLENAFIYRFVRHTGDTRYMTTSYCYTETKYGRTS